MSKPLDVERLRVTSRRTIPTIPTLFSVEPDVPLDKALGLATDLLGSAADAAFNTPSNAANGVAYLIVMAQGIIDSLIDPAAINASFPTVSSVTLFLEGQIRDSRKQAEKEEGQGKAFYEGRVSAFELALSELREVAK